MVREFAKRLAKSDQIARDQLGSLMNKLVERVLPVGARLAPDDRRSLVVYGLAVERHVLAVAFHLELLQVRRKALEIVRVRHDADGLRAEKVVVPDGKQAHQDRKVLLQRSSPEVLVHLVKSGEQFFEALRTDRDHRGESDGGVHRIASSNPVPEFEHVGGVDSKLADSLCVGRDRHEVLGHSGIAF